MPAHATAEGIGDAQDESSEVDGLLVGGGGVVGKDGGVFVSSFSLHFFLQHHLCCKSSFANNNHVAEK